MGAVCVEKTLLSPEGRNTMTLSVSTVGGVTRLRKTLTTREPSGPKRGLSGLQEKTYFSRMDTVCTEVVGHAQSELMVGH